MSNLPTNTSYLSVFSANAGKYGPEKTPYLDTFHTMNLEISVAKTTQKKLGISNLVSKRPYHIEGFKYGTFMKSKACVYLQKINSGNQF